MNMKIEYFKTDDMIPYVHSAKEHPEEQINKIARSIKAFGFNVPILIDSNNEIIAGHGRLLAAQKLDMENIPVVRLEHLSPAEIRAFRIADNKLAESAWLLDQLAIEFEALKEIGFDLELTGFDISEINKVLDAVNIKEGLTDPDDIPDVPDAPVSKYGDLWILGDHRLFCGDATKTEDIKALMDGELADMVFTDPPYNVDYTGGNKKKLKIQNDNLSGDRFYELLYRSYLNMFLYTVKGGGIYVCHSDAEWKSFRTAMVEAGWLLKQCLIWVKNSFVLGRQDYHWRHEPILYGWKPGTAHKWYGGRNQQTIIENSDSLVITEDGVSTILSYSAGAQSVVLRVPSYELIYAGDDSLTSIWRIEKPLKNEDHPTIKPTALIKRAITNSSKRDGIVLDVFGGSGSTMIACELTDRKCRMMELGPYYCDVIIKRWELFTGERAVLAQN